MLKHFIVRANTNDEYYDDRLVAMLVAVDTDIKDTVVKLSTKVKELGVYQISLFDSTPIGIPSNIIQDEDLLEKLDTCEEEAIAISVDEYNAIIKQMGDEAINVDSMTMHVDTDSVKWEGYYKHTNILVSSGHIELEKILK